MRFLVFAHQVLHGVRSQHAERVDQRQRVHVAFVGDARDQVQHPVDFRAGEVDREEDDFEALRVRVGRRFDRQIDGLLAAATCRRIR